MNPFKGRHFQRDIILWAVRWYCKYGISYRELQEMLAERGVNVDHSTIYRWVQRYAPEMEKRLRWYWRNPSDLCPWHMDIIEAPSSTKNKEQQRDPEMHQTKKGNQWHFGMKAHIGVDAKSGLTHSLVTTAANEHDLNQLGNLLHGEEQFVSADAGYQGAPQREELAEVDVDWLIAERPGKVRTLKQHPRKNKTAINIEYMKASIRARVEHPFRIIKRQFGFVKARYKGLLKNDNQLAMLFTLANLFRADQMIRQWERSH
ncbi:IS1 transposition protein B [Salmonella phage SJ1]